MKLDYTEFKNNPIQYILFLPLIALVTLFFISKNTDKNRVKDKDIIIEKLENKLDKAENKQVKTDSNLHSVYQLLGAKKILDSLK